MVIIKKRLALCLFVALVQPGLTAPACDGKIAALGNRLFPVLTALDASAEPVSVQTMLRARRNRIAACGNDGECKIAAASWNKAESTLLADFAAQKVAPKAANQTSSSPEEVWAGAKRELDGINAILRVYGAGAAPRYPSIDGPDAATDKDRFKKDVDTAIALNEIGQDGLDPSIGLSLELLDVAGRLDAIAFEPLDSGYNQAAMERSRALNWTNYRYTAIIVPGIGPDDLTTPLSAIGKLNVRLAAKRYFDKVAPFIIVTGGFVHPRGSHFAEAVEMRRALIDRYNVPADAVLIEPYARHTTTNLRNASRLLSALHAPFDRDAAIVSNAEQSLYIESIEFKDRNLRELGYLPGTLGGRVSPFELIFRPASQSSRVDPADPLDP